ncbi:hypothetical protein BGX29_010126 [Mortierella sp. GBA35]|nr:hypothetical protein BGX29_010126 [Mortierella sp. GBA35]
MVLQLEQAHDRILQQTMDSIRQGTFSVQQSMAKSLDAQFERTHKSVTAALELFTNNTDYHGNNNDATAIAMAELNVVIENHTQAVSRIATEMNQWTLQLLTALTGSSMIAAKSLAVDGLSLVLNHQSSSASTSRMGGIPLSPLSPTSSHSSSTTSVNVQQQRMPPFKFDRRATTIRRMLEECHRYKVCKYQDRYLGYDKASQFHSYRAEERYIQARMVVFEEVKFFTVTHGGGGGGGEEEKAEDEAAIVWLEKEFIKMDGSTARFLEILKERQKLRQSQVRRM